MSKPGTRGIAPVGVMFAAYIAIALDGADFGRLVCGSLGAGIAARSSRCRRYCERGMAGV